MVVVVNLPLHWNDTIKMVLHGVNMQPDNQVCGTAPRSTNHTKGQLSPSIFFVEQLVDPDLTVLEEATNMTHAWFQRYIEPFSSSSRIKLRIGSRLWKIMHLVIKLTLLVEWGQKVVRNIVSI